MKDERKYQLHEEWAHFRWMKRSAAPSHCSGLLSLRPQPCSTGVPPADSWSPQDATIQVMGSIYKRQSCSCFVASPRCGYLYPPRVLPTSSSKKLEDQKYGRRGRIGLGWTNHLVPNTGSSHLDFHPRFGVSSSSQLSRFMP